METWIIILIVVVVFFGLIGLYFYSKKSKSNSKKKSNQEHLIEGELEQMNSYYNNNQNQNKNYIDTYSYDVKQDTQTNQKNKENYGRDNTKQQNIYQNNKSSNTVAIDIKPNNSQHNMHLKILQQTEEQKPQQIYQKIDHCYQQQNNQNAQLQNFKDDQEQNIQNEQLQQIFDYQQQNNQNVQQQNNQDNQLQHYQNAFQQHNQDNQQQNDLNVDQQQNQNTQQVIDEVERINVDISKILGNLQQIINETSKKRELAEEYKYYIRKYQGKSELKKNYGLTLKASVELYKYCNAFREVRGDGNCFYTAFGFQFLSILLFDYSLDQFNEFFNRIKQIELPMKIFVPLTDLKIDDKELEKQLLDEFQRRMLKLKLIEDINQRQEQFHTEFAAYEQQSDEIDGCLYGLSTLFFRNYSNYVIDFSDAKDAVFDREKLLNWEEECNSNEVVIAELAKQLNILVQLIFIQNSENIVVREYGNNKEHKIILLIKPGHYNIGYQIFKQS
ncbi:unnamed protein product [Paramecium octaurelia]|uniref:OTU domain-containing protein n=1 Tax=Paramecium octaurelia TaxID=43137 RepID=A0A8S1YLK2_PAROT|nr:unnamed protein product [Paramecium octaurelia]